MNFPSPLLLLFCCAPLLFGACTSVKSDDHSYTYVYQHQTQPPREVTETVTTKTVRTRNYVPRRGEEADSGTSKEGNSGASDREIIEGLRSDPFAPSRIPGQGAREIPPGSETGMFSPAEAVLVPGEPEFVPVPVFAETQVSAPRAYGLRPAVSVGVSYPTLRAPRPVVVGVPWFASATRFSRPVPAGMCQSSSGGFGFGASCGRYSPAHTGIRPAGSGCYFPRASCGGAFLQQASYARALPQTPAGARPVPRM
jgi:hypothetical protein